MTLPHPHRIRVLWAQDFVDRGYGLIFQAWVIASPKFRVKGSRIRHRPSLESSHNISYTYVTAGRSLLHKGKPWARSSLV